MMSQATEATPLIGHTNFKCGSIALRVRILTSIISLAEGYDIGVVNGAVVLFKEELGLTPVQVGIALSIFPLHVAIAAPTAASLADWAGRKAAMMVSSICLIVGGILMASATNFEMLVVGRATAGFGVGTGITAVTAYMSEVSPARERGFYGSLEELFVNVGNVAGYLINVALLGVPYDWRWMLGLGILPAVAVMGTLMLPYTLTGIPESPRYLQKKGKHSEARAILLDLLHGDEAEVNRAFQDWAAESTLEVGMATWPESLVAFCTTMRRQALAGIGCGVLNMFTGIMLMMVTTTSLLMGAGMTKELAMRASVGLGAAKAGVMLSVAWFALDAWGRRPLLLSSLAFCALSTALGAAAAAFAWGNAWVVLFLCLFVTGYSFGVGPVPWVYMPEVLGSRFRGKGCALGLAGARLCAVAHLFLFPMAFPIIGVAGLFLFLFVVNVLGYLYVFLLCPETKGQSLENIPKSAFPT